AAGTATPSAEMMVTTVTRSIRSRGRFILLSRMSGDSWGIGGKRVHTSSRPGVNGTFVQSLVESAPLSSAQTFRHVQGAIERDRASSGHAFDSDDWEHLLARRPRAATDAAARMAEV